jgi:hypothetical protein
MAQPPPSSQATAIGFALAVFGLLAAVIIYALTG